mmetsp:Transcript_37520/g.81692  ORF Transcript_37520/g.81692 Transcript_37520/m.81692 type:complete len:345 (+) Transcript_37520:1078-2112(+)
MTHVAENAELVEERPVGRQPARLRREELDGHGAAAEAALHHEPEGAASQDLLAVYGYLLLLQHPLLLPAELQHLHEACAGVRGLADFRKAPLEDGSGRGGHGPGGGCAVLAAGLRGPGHEVQVPLELRLGPEVPLAGDGQEVGPVHHLQRPQAHGGGDEQHAEEEHEVPVRRPLHDAEQDEEQEDRSVEEQHRAPADGQHDVRHGDQGVEGQGRLRLAEVLEIDVLPLVRVLRGLPLEQGLRDQHEEQEGLAGAVADVPLHQLQPHHHGDGEADAGEGRRDVGPLPLVAEDRPACVPGASDHHVEDRVQIHEPPKQRHACSAAEHPVQFALEVGILHPRLLEYQ